MSVTAGRNRKITDRRILDQPTPDDVRTQPDRRLNNIAVQWISFEEVILQPVLCKVLGFHRHE